MPPLSQAQRGAMAAAKAGHSTLGIPQKVGADFMAADKGGKLPMHVKPKGNFHLAKEGRKGKSRR